MQGVTEYEPKVLQQLMDFMYRYTAEVLQDAEVGTASPAGRGRGAAPPRRAAPRPPTQSRCRPGRGGLREAPQPRLQPLVIVSLDVSLIVYLCSRVEAGPLSGDSTQPPHPPAHLPPTSCQCWRSPSPPTHLSPFHYHVPIHLSPTHLSPTPPPTPTWCRPLRSGLARRAARSPCPT